MVRVMHKPKAETIPDLLAELAATDSERPFIIDGEARYTYGEFNDRIRQISCRLLAEEIGPGDRIGILAGNRSEWLAAFFAAMNIGAIAVGLNTWATPQELSYQLVHAEIRMLFAEPECGGRDFVSLIALAREMAEPFEVTNLVWFDQPGPQVMPALTLAAWLGEAPPSDDTALSEHSAAVAPGDIACLLYTSGSTALPKGVPLQHAGLINNMWEIGERQHLTADDRLWLAVSLFWSLASVNAVFALMTHRASIVLQHQFDASVALDLIEREACTVFYGTPNMALALADHQVTAKRDLSSLQTGVTIGTPAQIQLLHDLGVERICNVYGLTETYGNSNVSDASLPIEKRTLTVGQALAGNEVAIFDPTSENRLPVGEQGEIVVRGRVTPGYWRDDEKNAEAFTKDGWFRTGDLGIVDEEGYLYFRGRLKELVKTGGINVAPAEVEAALCTHDAVELAFVTGIPDPKLDEALAAVIVLRNGQHADPEALKSHVRKSLARYKTPRHFVFAQADELPLTTTGKLKRNQLPSLFD